jgi:D-amino-acid dehydrogenase
VAGLWATANAQVDRPGELLRVFAARFAAEGGQIVRDDVTDIEAEGGGVVVRGATGSYRGEQAVLATGPWSARLARRLGCRVPLIAERGYHLMLPQVRMPIERTLYSARGSFVLAPMGEALRLTGGAEIARLESPADERPLRRLLGEVRRLLPGADVDVETSWMGSRPSTPDSLPVIARAPGLTRVVVAYGHGHLGLTQGPITGRIVADLVGGRAPRIALDAFGARR